MILNKLTDKANWSEKARSIWPEFYETAGGREKIDEALTIMSR